MKKEIVFYILSGIFIGTISLGGLFTYAAVQSEVGISSWQVLAGTVPGWKRIGNFLNSSDGVAFPVAELVPGAAITLDVEAIPYGFNGTTNDRQRTVGVGDNYAGVGLMAQGQFLFDGTNWNRLRSTIIGGGGDGLTAGINALMIYDSANDVFNRARAAEDAGGGLHPEDVPAFTPFYHDGGSSLELQRAQGASAVNLSAATLSGVGLNVVPSTWTETDTPLATVQASASHAAGGAGVFHVATGITACITDTDTAFGTAILELRDGATGAGTVLITWYLDFPAANDSKCISPPIPSLLGSDNTAMTLEFTAGGTANSLETVSIFGFSVP